MSNKSIFSEFGKENVAKGFMDHMNKIMIDEAEPIIQEALKEIEATMRKTLASHVIQFVGSNYDLEFDAQYIKILIRKDK